MEAILNAVPENWKPIIMIVIGVLILFNVVMNGIKTFLDSVQVAKPSEGTEKAITVMGKIVAWTNKIVEYVSANKSK